MNKMDESRAALEEKIIQRAMEDEEFKTLLLKDPHKAIAKLGVNIPKEMEIKILEETSKTSYLVLPFVTDELSDDALSLISGGAFCNCTGNQISHNDNNL
jgi:hypothetical protein